METGQPGGQGSGRHSNQHNVMRRVGAIVAVMLAGLSAVPVAAQTTLTNTTALTVTGSTLAQGTPGRIGIDLIYERGGAGVYDIWPCTHNQRLPQLGWDSSGVWAGRTTFSALRSDWGALTLVRFELYPHECGHYDPWSGDVGGAHVQRSPADGPAWLNVGQVPVPRPDNGAFPIRGRLLSSTPLTNARVEFDVFQVAYGYPDTVLVDNLPPTRRTSSGAESLAFATSTNRGDRWSGHWGWPGRYIMFVRDTATNRHVHGFVEIRKGRIPTIDLDAVCFGLDTCVYDRGSPGPVTGGFHPLVPTRILDSRAGSGLPGALPTGDGRSSHPDARIRRLTSAQHEMVVVGRAGVPRAGVAAVVLNVTAVTAPRNGSVSVVPRPAQTNIFDDQGTFARAVGTTNLDMAAGSTISQTVVARVGAGGVIRVANRGGATHVTADIMGWIDSTGGAGSGSGAGSGLVPVPRATLFDTARSDVPLAADVPTRLDVSVMGQVPTDATAVMLEVTAGDPEADGHVVLWAGDRRRPAVSHMNLQAGQRRSNTVIVPVAGDGTIDVVSVATSTELRIDVVGAFVPGRSGVTVVDPRRVVDSRRAVGVATGPLRAGTSVGVMLPHAVVPADVSAVLIHVTAAAPMGANPGRNGLLRVWGQGAPVPDTPHIVFQTGRTVSQLLLVQPDARGRLRVAVSAADTHLMMDVVGYVR